MLKEKKLKIGIIGIKGLPASRGADSVVEAFIPHLINKGHGVWIYGDEWGKLTDKDKFKPIKMKSVPVKNMSGRNFKRILK